MNWYKAFDNIKFKRHENLVYQKYLKATKLLALSACSGITLFINQ